MFSIIWNKKKCSSSSSCEDEGLRLILKKLANANSRYVVVKPIVLVDCYLKSCHLCHKPFHPEKEIYMYRGDLGFCSVECRDRQIYIDETKELEAAASTKKILLSSSFRKGRGRCETYRPTPRHPFLSGENRVIFLL